MDNQSEIKIQKTTNMVTMWIAIVSVILIVFSLFPFMSVFAKERGPVGDMIGGITNPLIGIVGAWLVYCSFQAQVRANKIQIDVMNDERRRRDDLDCDLFVKDSIGNLLSYIDRMEFYILDQNGFQQECYRGIQAVYRYSLSAFADSIKSYNDNKLLLDQLNNWVFQLNVAANGVRQYCSDRSIYAGHLNMLYLSTLQRSLITLIEAPVSDVEAKRIISMIQKEVKKFESWIDEHASKIKSAE